MNLPDFVSIPNLNARELMLKGFRGSKEAIYNNNSRFDPITHYNENFRGIMPNPKEKAIPLGIHRQSFSVSPAPDPVLMSKSFGFWCNIYVCRVVFG